MNARSFPFGTALLPSPTPPIRSVPSVATMLAMLAMLAILAILVPVGSASAQAPAADPAPARVEVRSDAQGSVLLVDGEPFFVKGMNWDYFPRGTNYLFSLWDQPHDFIVEALQTEMPLLQAMGVNAIRVYNGIPAEWITYIWKRWGIWTILNHPMARYGYTLDGVWIAQVDYADPKLREAVTAEITGLVEDLKDTPGLLMWLLGNENNYGLSWTSFEIEALPEGEKDAARARQLYSLFEKVTRSIHAADPSRPVAIANGDVQYIDVIAQECTSLDIFGTNVYRGISARDLFQVVQAKLGVPVMYTEFGADAFNAKDMREDQIMQARYLIGQWRELYEQSHGKGRVGNAIGGCTFQWSDGWWKYGQDSNLDVHDTNASWPNGGYVEDYVQGRNNMNEEWWGICAKGPTDAQGHYELYPRAAYYALMDAYALDPYGPATDLEAIRIHFGGIQPAVAKLRARGDTAARVAEARQQVHLSGLRLEFETFSTGGSHITTPEADAPQQALPSYQGFDHLQSFYADFEVQPTEAVRGEVSLNVLGNVPVNPIDEIFYENRGRRIEVDSGSDTLEIEGLDRVQVYRASVSWDDQLFRLNAFYRTGHTHWGYEGDFFGLYQDAYYGENIDIYNGIAPLGAEIAGKNALDGLKLAFGPELWWGANPAMLVKYRRNVGPFDMTAVFQEDFQRRQESTSSIAIPMPENRKATLAAATDVGPFGVQLGVIWSGSTLKGRRIQVPEERDGRTVALQDEVVAKDTWGTKAKLTWERGRWHWYGQGHYLGAVASGGPDFTTTYTGWTLKEGAWGNQASVSTGVAVDVGRFQISPNFLWQKPLIGPIPADVAAPGRPRNILQDPFSVRANREMTAAELLLTYDPTPATWMWAWDNIEREDAPLAWSLGYVFRHQPTTMDAAIYVSAEGELFPFPGATPPRDLWELKGRVVGRLRPDVRLVANLYWGLGEPNGENPRKIERYGGDVTLAWGRARLAGFARFNDWGPYDYHKDFNLTFPVQLIGDASWSLGTPRWFDFPQTRLGVRATWRSLDEYSPRYVPPPTLEDGSEWEIRTYLHVSL